MISSEKHAEIVLRKALEPLRTVKIHGHEMQQPGLPDFFVIGKKNVVWVEMKFGQNKPSRIQTRFLYMLPRALCVTYAASLWYIKEYLDPPSTARGNLDMVVKWITRLANE